MHSTEPASSRARLAGDTEAEDAEAGGRPVFGIAPHGTSMDVADPTGEQDRAVPDREDAANQRTGRWSQEEHEGFVEGLRAFGQDWKRIRTVVRTRSIVQVRTHAQKYFARLAKRGQPRPAPGGDVLASSGSFLDVEPTGDRTKKAGAKRRGRDGSGKQGKASARTAAETGEEQQLPAGAHADRSRAVNPIWPSPDPDELHDEMKRAGQAADTHRSLAAQLACSRFAASATPLPPAGRSGGLDEDAATAELELPSLPSLPLGGSSDTPTFNLPSLTPPAALPPDPSPAGAASSASAGVASSLPAAPAAPLSSSSSSSSSSPSAERQAGAALPRSPPPASGAMAPPAIIPARQPAPHPGAARLILHHSLCRLPIAVADASVRFRSEPVRPDLLLGAGPVDTTLFVGPATAAACAAAAADTHAFGFELQLQPGAIFCRTRNKPPPLEAALASAPTPSAPHPYIVGVCGLSTAGLPPSMVTALLDQAMRAACSSHRLATDAARRVASSGERPPAISPPSIVVHTSDVAPPLRDLGLVTEQLFQAASGLMGGPVVTCPQLRQLLFVHATWLRSWTETAEAAAKPAGTAGVAPAGASAALARGGDLPPTCLYAASVVHSFGISFLRLLQRRAQERVMALEEMLRRQNEQAARAAAMAAVFEPHSVAHAAPHEVGHQHLMHPGAPFDGARPRAGSDASGLGADLRPSRAAVEPRSDSTWSAGGPPLPGHLGEMPRPDGMH